MSIFDRLKRLFGGGATNGDGVRGDGHGPEAVEMIPCEEALRLVHDFLDGELEGVPLEQVRRHFEVCERCYPHLRLEEAYREAMRRAASGETAPAGLRSRVAAMLAEADRGD